MQNLINHLTQHNVKNARGNTAAKTSQLREQRKILSLLMQKVFCAKNKYPYFQQQLDDLTAEIIAASRQTDDPARRINNLIAKYQELLKLILTNLSGSSRGSTTAQLQMPIFNQNNIKEYLTSTCKKINVFLRENARAKPGAKQSIGELVANIIIGIFSFFLSDLDEIDEQAKKELNKELTKYQQQQKDHNIFKQISLLLQQTSKTPSLQKSNNKKNEATNFFPTPFKPEPTPASSSKKEKD